MDGFDLIRNMRNLRRKYRFTVIEQALFYELFTIYMLEKTNIFFCSNTELINSLYISESSLLKARKKLITAGLLLYQAAKSKRSVGEYSFPNHIANDANTQSTTNHTPFLPFTDKAFGKNDKFKRISPKRFIPPTLSEITAYCQERQNGIDPQKFIDHYTANGWMRGKTKVKDWKACVRTWEKNRNNENNKTNNSKPKDYGVQF